MSEKLEDSIYDDEAAVRFIQSHIPQELQGKYTDDDILLTIDTMMDYYGSSKRSGEYRKMESREEFR